METKKLKISNDNNKLACSGFLQIHFAPDHGSVKEEDFGRTYLVQHDGKSILVKMVDFARIRFDRIGSILTIPATGKDWKAWREDWLKKYPRTRPDTEMGVYCYVRENDDKF